MKLTLEINMDYFAFMDSPAEMAGRMLQQAKEKLEARVNRNEVILLLDHNGKVRGQFSVTDED